MEAGLEILAEGKGWVAVHKPAGIGVEKHFNYDTVERRALQIFQREGASKPPFVGIVHRLDRPVSGVLLLARNKSTLVALNTLFAENKVEKTYHATVSQAPPQAAGRLRHFLLRDKFGKKAIAATRPLPGAKEGILDYRLLENKDGHFLLEIKPISGRFHQIRAQLSAIGCPIMGDALYGSLHPFRGENSIALEAVSLTFTPPGERNTLTITTKNLR